VYYERNLPHYQPPDASYLVNIRLAGSLPAQALEQIRYDYEFFKRSLAGKFLTKGRMVEYRERQFQYILDVDRILDTSGKQGEYWLQRTEVAEIIAEALHHRDGKTYDLLSYCIMPNHVHIVFNLGAIAGSGGRADLGDPSGESPFPVTRLMASLKKYTARRANEVLGRKGIFWQHESFDHVIRDSVELERILWYVINNPVAAGLAKSWTDWKWTYCKPGLLFDE